jgi:hypothetical protein
MKTEENNKLIAEFMGVNLIEGQEGEYHTSWDWLMPVVEKIDEVSNDNTLFKIEYNRAFIEDIENYHLLIDVMANSRLEATYKAVVEFIKQYNK